jgi:anti-sigma factor RsiW
MAAGLAVAAVVIGGLGFHSDLATDAVQAHIRSLTAGRLVDVAASGPHSVTPWLAGKLDFTLRVDDVSGPGFVLRGGRLDHLAGRSVAALVYGRGPHVINVFVWPAREQPDRAPDGRTVGGFNVVHWRADGMNWWAVSDLRLGELEQLPLCPCFLPAHETLRG